MAPEIKELMDKVRAGHKFSSNITCNEDLYDAEKADVYSLGIAFGKIAKTIFNVDTDDICSSNLKRFNFTKVDNKRYWPLNE